MRRVAKSAEMMVCLSVQTAKIFEKNHLAEKNEKKRKKNFDLVLLKNHILLFNFFSTGW